MLSTHALPSALAQEDVSLEVVVVDDASDDDTAAPGRRVGDPRAARPERVNRRLPASRNVGAEVARGAWLAFLDDDDLWSPRKLRAQLDTAQTTGADWVYAMCIVVDGDRRPLDIHPFPDPTVSRCFSEGTTCQAAARTSSSAQNVSGRRPLRREPPLLRGLGLWLRLVHVTSSATCPERSSPASSTENMLFRDQANVGADFERVLAKQGAVSDGQRLADVRVDGPRAHAACLYLGPQVSTRGRHPHRSPGNAVAAAGALFGRRGLAVASRRLLATRGATHLEEAAAPPPPEAPPGSPPSPSRERVCARRRPARRSLVRVRVLPRRRGRWTVDVGKAEGARRAAELPRPALADQRVGVRSQGHRVLPVNPCDPRARPANYPSIWLLPSTLGLGEDVPFRSALDWLSCSSSRRSP